VKTPRNIVNTAIYAAAWHAHQTDRDPYTEALAADDAWGAELRRLFGKRAGDVRYTERGAGEPGSELRCLYDAKLAADERLWRAWRIAARRGMKEIGL
jgi:hypothetical protein